MPAEGLPWLPKAEILTYEEIARLAGAFFAMGVRTIRLTGGEPTVRRDLPELVRMFRAVAPDADLSMTTNGLLLDVLAAPLKEAGLDRVNVSMDSLLRHRFAEMTRRDALDGVCAGSAPPRRPALHRSSSTASFCRNQRRRGRRLRLLRARHRLRGPFHRVHAPRRRPRVGAREGAAEP